MMRNLDTLQESDSKMDRTCQIEYAAAWSDVRLPCGKPAVTRCADCGTSICSDCEMECCGQSFCGACYDYHATHSCRKSVHNERHIFGSYKAG